MYHEGLSLLSLSQKKTRVRAPPPPGGAGPGSLNAERVIGPSGFRWPLSPTSPHQVIPKAMRAASRQLAGVVVLGGRGRRLHQHQRRHSQGEGKGGTRRLNWSEAFSRAYWAPTPWPTRRGLSAEPAASGWGPPTGGLGRHGEPVVGSPTPPGHAKPGYALENESPARRRSAGGCQVVGAGPRLPELGRNWAQTEARGGWWGPGPAAGGGAARRPAQVTF
jgi:hypothetical protein